MPYAAGRDAFGYRSWGRDPSAFQGPFRGAFSRTFPGAERRYAEPRFGDWGTGVHYWQPGGINRPLAALLTVVLGFLFWWPAGLAILLYMVGTGRMGRVRRRSNQSAYQSQDGEDGAEASWNAAASGGNHAFDEYRAETLRRMEAEQEEFAAFVERLRFARDKAEFDQFMAERRAASAGTRDPSQGQSAG